MGAEAIVVYIGHNPLAVGEGEEEGRGGGREGSAPYIMTWWSLPTVRQTCTVNPACGVV